MSPSHPYSVVLREIYSLPDEWQWFETRVVGGDTMPPEHWTHVQFKGGVYPPKTRGPDKGSPNYRKPVPGTERTLVISMDEMRERTKGMWETGK